jgi:hypothetical protein
MALLFSPGWFIRFDVSLRMQKTMPITVKVPILRMFSQNKQATFKMHLNINFQTFSLWFEKKL